MPVRHLYVFYSGIGMISITVVQSLTGILEQEFFGIFRSDILRNKFEAPLKIPHRSVCIPLGKPFLPMIKNFRQQPFSLRFERPIL